MTTHKLSEVNRLPEERKAPSLRVVVENRLSTDETRELVQRVERGISPDEAANEVVLEREARKPERYAERKRRVECPTCKGRGYLLRSDTID